MALAQAPSKPDRLVMVCESKETKLYISEDSGENWKEQASTFNVKARPFIFLPLNLIPRTLIDYTDPPSVCRSVTMVGIHSMMRPGCWRMQTTMRFGLILPILTDVLGYRWWCDMSVDRATTGNLFVVFPYHNSTM